MTQRVPFAVVAVFSFVLVQSLGIEEADIKRASTPGGRLT